jgi:hypothetical protein
MEEILLKILSIFKTSMAKDKMHGTIEEDK